MYSTMFLDSNSLMHLTLDYTQHHWYIQHSTVPLYRMGDWPTSGKLKQTNFTDSHKIIENNTVYTESTYYSLSTGP